MDKQIEEILCCEKCYKAERGLCNKRNILNCCGNADVVVREMANRKGVEVE